MEDFLGGFVTGGTLAFMIMSYVCNILNNEAEKEKKRVREFKNHITYWQRIYMVSFLERRGIVKNFSKFNLDNGEHRQKHMDAVKDDCEFPYYLYGYEGSMLKSYMEGLIDENGNMIGDKYSAYNRNLKLVVNNEKNK